MLKLSKNKKTFIALGVLVLIVLLAYCSLRTDNKKYSEETVMLESLFPEIAQLKVDYLRTDDCRKFVYSPENTNEVIWAADPRNQECGSENKYLPFTNEDEQSFQQLTDHINQTLGSKQLKELEIKYTSQNEISSFELGFLNPGFRKPVGYLYKLDGVENTDDYTHIGDGWYLINYDPNPF